MVSKWWHSTCSISLLASALLSAPPASAGLSYSGLFTAPGSGGDNGSYYLVGQAASQSFSVPWLTEVSSLQLTLNLMPPSPWFSNNLNEPLEFSFELNGTTVGSTRYLAKNMPGQWQARDLDFDFAPLFDAGGDWTLRMVVSQAGNPCCAPGNIMLSANNPFAISIPEPNGLALVALGLVGAGLFYRRR